MSALLRILAFTRQLTPYYLGIALCAAVVTAAGLAVPFVIGVATDTVSGSLSNPQGVGSAVRAVIFLALALLLAEIVDTVVSNVGGYWGDVMSAKMRTILSSRYFEKLLLLPQRYYDNELTGTIVARLNRSINEVTNFVKSFSNLFITLLLTTVAVLGISAYYYWPLAVLLAVAYPLYFWLTTLTSKKWQRLEDAKNVHVDVASGRFAEVIGQIRVVKSFARERSELREFDRNFEATVGLTQEQSRHWHRMDALRRGVLNVIFAALYLMIFLRTLDRHFSLGTMVMLIQLMAMARQPVTSLSWVVDTAQRAIAGSRSYFEVIELDPDTVDPRRPAPSDAARGPREGAPKVAFRDVRFGYDGGEDVLSDITFEVPEGRKVAFVGESGGGKTTLVNLLMGLYSIRDGAIEVDGRDIRAMDLGELRRGVGVVFQDPSLFSGTVRENIAYGRPYATDEEIVEVAKRAAVHEFVSKFPDGYETVIGERGLKLSGGQKQRIAVARAMLKDAPILVLDEATSALDTKSERLVQAGLEDLMRGRTSLIIAHRLSTIAGVDTIVTLREGKIDEIGSPAELAASGGIYAELLALQGSTAKADRKRLREFDVIG